MNDTNQEQYQLNNNIYVIKFNALIYDILIVIHFLENNLCKIEIIIKGKVSLYLKHLMTDCEYSLQENKIKIIVTDDFLNKINELNKIKKNKLTEKEIIGTFDKNNNKLVFLVIAFKLTARDFNNLDLKNQDYVKNNIKFISIEKK